MEGILWKKFADVGFGSRLCPFSVISLPPWLWDWTVCKELTNLGRLQLAKRKSHASPCRFNHWLSLDFAAFCLDNHFLTIAPQLSTKQQSVDAYEGVDNWPNIKIQFIDLFYFSMIHFGYKIVTLVCFGEEKVIYYFYSERVMLLYTLNFSHNPRSLSGSVQSNKLRRILDSKKCTAIYK